MLLLIFWIALSSSVCTVSECDTKALLLRVELNCNDRASCLDELKFQKKAIVPVDAEKIFNERLRSDLKGRFRNLGGTDVEKNLEFEQKRDALMRIPRDFDSILAYGDQTRYAVIDVLCGKLNCHQPIDFDFDFDFDFFCSFLLILNYSDWRVKSHIRLYTGEYTFFSDCGISIGASTVEAFECWV
jgi:hypothetical protein